MAAVLALPEILLKLFVACGHLLLAKLVTLLLLFQYEQQILLPVALQIPCDLVLARLYARIPQLSQLTRIAFASQNGRDDGLSGDPADIAQHVRQLDIHLRQGLLHALDVPPCRLHQIVALTPVRAHRADLLGRPERIAQQAVGV